MELIVAHLVGDFLLQNEWMASRKNKPGGAIPCLVHVVLYMLPFLLIGLLWWQLVLIAVQHYIQDRTELTLWWMRHYKRASPQWTEGNLYVDQAIHLVWIQAVVWLGHVLPTLGS